jgi:hypothetical protein
MAAKTSKRYLFLNSDCMFKYFHWHQLQRKLPFYYALLKLLLL